MFTKIVTITVVKQTLILYVLYLFLSPPAIDQFILLQQNQHIHSISLLIITVEHFSCKLNIWSAIVKCMNSHNCYVLCRLLLRLLWLWSSKVSKNHCYRLLGLGSVEKDRSKLGSGRWYTILRIGINKRRLILLRKGKLSFNRLIQIDKNCLIINSNILL